MRRVVESEEELSNDDESSAEESKEISNKEKLQRHRRNKGISVMKRRQNKNVCSQDGGEDGCDSDEADGNVGEDLSNVTEPFLPPHAKCEQHKLVIHSFEKRSKKLLCTQCVQEGNIPNDYLQVFP